MLLNLPDSDLLQETRSESVPAAVLARQHTVLVALWYVWDAVLPYPFLVACVLSML
jgi:hypothetical protein